MGLRQRIREPARQHRTHRMKPVLERGDHAEVSTAAPDSPEEVFVLLGARRQPPTIRGYYVCEDKVVAGEAVLTVEPAEAAPEGEPCDTSHRDHPEGGRQPELLRLQIELAEIG